MTDTAEQLETETEKWRDRLQDRLAQLEPVDDDGEMILENARAYLEDADHFEEDGDMVRAFEAVVWGWSWVEIGEELELLVEE
ncbi:MAG: DUF357 domain-containing protein [Candidatus Nanohaloarchaea archaeon]